MMTIQQRSHQRRKPKKQEPMWLKKTAANRHRTRQALDAIKFIDDIAYAPKEVDEAIQRLVKSGDRL